MHQDPSIVVVGAGLAGLSAAYKLIELGHRDFIVLEARSKPGGRIESQTFPSGVEVNMGAQWLHGGKGNPIYNWLDKLDLVEGPEEDEVEMEGLFRTQDGHDAPSEVVSRVLEVLLDAKRVLYDTAKIFPVNSRPVEIYERELKAQRVRCSILKRSDVAIIDAVYTWFKLYEAIDNSCDDLSLLSMRAYSNWQDIDEGQMTRVRGGWWGVVRKLIDFVCQERIVCDCKVEKLNYHDKGVQILHSKGVTNTRHVIMTSSIGVLKESVQSLIEPQLSEVRITAIKNIGFGVVDKIFLEFEEPYLQTEKGVKMLWIKKIDDLPEWTRYITGFDIVPHAENILLGWIGGKGAREVEKLTEEEVGKVCLQLMSRFLPDKAPPKLISIKFSSWGKDPNIKGSYSYPSFSADNLDTKRIWDPLSAPGAQRTPQVQFAGEATIHGHYATAHGAILSGWREAILLHRALSERKSFQV